MNEFLKTATQALELSQLQIKKYFRQPLTIENKSDESPVTIADKSTEELIRKTILENHPDHGILGEEYGIDNPDATYQWVIDPIDGTKSFITGMPLFGTLIGLTRDSNPLMGIIDMPILGERWIGINGETRLLNNQSCRVSDIKHLDQAKLYCTHPDMYANHQLDCFNKLTDEVQLRRFGGDCYAYGLLASGYIDLVVEGDLKYYDILALIPVVEGAGGIITDWRGDPLSSNLDGLVVAAATRELHQAAVNILNEVYT